MAARCSAVRGRDGAAPGWCGCSTCAIPALTCQDALNLVLVEKRSLAVGLNSDLPRPAIDILQRQA